MGPDFSALHILAAEVASQYSRRGRPLVEAEAAALEAVRDFKAEHSERTRRQTAERLAAKTRSVFAKPKRPASTELEEERARRRSFAGTVSGTRHIWNRRTPMDPG